MLRIGERRVARREAEELGVELVDVVEHRRRVHVAGQARDVIGHAGGAHLVLAEHRDRLDAVGEVAPEGVEIVGAGKPAAHADDGDRFGAARSAGRGRFRRCRCCRSAPHLRAPRGGDVQRHLEVQALLTHEPQHADVQHVGFVDAGIEPTATCGRRTSSPGPSGLFERRQRNRRDEGRTDAVGTTHRGRQAADDERLGARVLDYRATRLRCRQEARSARARPILRPHRRRPARPEGSPRSASSADR